MIKKSIPAFLALSACAGVFLAIQSMLPPPASASGIVPAIVPALVPSANKTSTTSTVFALASSNVLTASSPVCTNANGDMTTTACTTNAVTSTTPVTVNTNTTSDQQLMELSLTAGYLNSLGRPFDFFGAGVYTTQTAQTPTLTFKIKLCTVSGCGSGTVVTLVSITSGATTAASSNISWNFRTVGTTAATGATGNLEIHGNAHLDLGSALSTASTVYNDTNTAVSSNIDLTAALFVDFTVAFSTNAATANTCTQREGVVNPGGSTSGGGGASGAMTQITKTVLGSPAASITFSAIAGTFNNLEVTLDGASSTAAATDVVLVRLNGDSAANYNYQQLLGSSTTPAAFQGVGTAANQCLGLQAANGVAGESGYANIRINNYAGTTFRKHLFCTSGDESADSAGNIFTWQTFIVWKNTAAVTSITLVLSSGANFIANTTAILYGIT